MERGGPQALSSTPRVQVCWTCPPGHLVTRPWEDQAVASPVVSPSRDRLRHRKPRPSVRKRKMDGGPGQAQDSEEGSEPGLGTDGKRTFRC